MLILILLCAGTPSCGRRKLLPDEIAHNRLFAEMLKRSDRREIGRDGFFERALLSPTFPDGREWGAVALGRIGDPAALPLLYQALDSADAALRAAAAFAIGEIEDRDTRQIEGRPLRPESILQLRRRLDDTAPAVRMRAVEALGRAGAEADGAEIGRRLRSLPRDRAPLGRAYADFAVTALMRLKAAGELQTLRDLALSDDPEIQWRAAHALFRLRDRAAFPVFRALLDSPHAAVRAHAARGLGICGNPEAVPLLIPLLHNRQPLAVRVCAVQACGMLREAAAVQPIARALAQIKGGAAPPEQTNFSVEAATALGELGSPDAVPTLEALVRLTGPASSAAIVALAKVLRSEPDRFFRIATRDRFSSPPALRSYARALGELGGAGATLELHAILRGSFDGSGTSAGFLAVPTVLEALAKTHAPDLDDIVGSFLQSHDGPIVRSALVAYQPHQGAPKPWLPVLDAYNRISASQDAETKTALLSRLEPWVAEPEVARTLETALHDRSRTARIAALRLLRAAGRNDASFDLGPAETSATDITYDLLAAYRQERTVAIIETGRGTIEIELFRHDAPLTVANFIALARRRFYDGLTFMRVVPFFVVQGGDPRNDQEGGPGYSIRCEINMRPFGQGSLGMALAGKDTGGSQFFITLAPQPQLDGGYTCFGHVISGMAVVERLIAGDRIEKIRIEDDVTALDHRRY